MWGFITVLNDILIPHLKSVFSLNYTQSMLIQFCFFGAYFLVSLPSSAILKRVGYKVGIVIGLCTMGIACALFVPAASSHSYPFFLTSLFILSSGITLLQVAANPFVAILGKSETSSSRLNLAQAFNSFGTFLAPLFGSAVILTTATTVGSEIDSVKMPYIGLAVVLFLLAGIIAVVKLPKIEDAEEPEVANVLSLDMKTSAWQYSHLILGAIAIFVYVGAEVSIGSFLVNFFGQPNMGGMSEKAAGEYVAFYWGGAMVGRFIGSAVLQRVRANLVLAFNAAAAIALVLIAMFTSGQVAMVSILLVGLFNSIMFPNIFTLSLIGLGKHTGQASGILCMAIVGGAIIPLIQGGIADSIGVQSAFFLPVICYGFIVYYSLFGYKSHATTLD